MLVLVIDDDSLYRKRMTAMLRQEGHDTLEAEEGVTAMSLAHDADPDMILVDQMMPGLSGEEVTGMLVRDLPDTPIVIVTSIDSADAAVRSLRLGAFDYLTKPVKAATLRQLLAQVAERRTLLTRTRVLEQDLDRSRGDSFVDGLGAAMRALYQLAGKVAATDATVLITGENGTGKEVLARWIQKASRRSDRPFVTVNCAALSAGLLESELFGHARGAFTGADKVRRGYLESADGGTLFLDEVAEVPPETQVKLLRFLQEREFTRVGETTARNADVRVLAATNRELEGLLASGALREDFYFRLNVFRLHMPPLRDRVEDIRPLFEALLAVQAAAVGRLAPRIGEDVIGVLQRHGWPGNVRELRNLVERLVILAGDEPVRLQDLPEDVIRGSHLQDAVSGTVGFAAQSDPLLEYVGDDYRQAKTEFEKAFLREQLRRHGGNMAAAARTIGMHPVSLRQKIARLGLAKSDEAS